MPLLINKKHSPVILGETEDSSGSIMREQNCLLMSDDGFKFRIHEKLLNQTQMMANIIEDSKDSGCSGIIKIFFLCEVRLSIMIPKLYVFMIEGRGGGRNENLP